MLGLWHEAKLDLDILGDVSSGATKRGKAVVKTVLNPVD